MKQLFKVTSILLCIVLLFSFTGCSEQNNAYIYFQLDELPQTLDPQTAKTDVELLISQNLYEGLMRYDENGKLVCAAAESYKKNGLVYTFTIRKDAKWQNGEKLTAHDFEFAFRRALSFDTAAPYASLLYSIKNGKAIASGDLINLDLGVKAINDRTLKIELEYDDPDFLEILAHPVAMPCNEEFFLSCKGKYGLYAEHTLSNGSYYLVKWSKEVFGIRIYRSDEYNGKFKAKNKAVYISYNKELSAAQTLAEDSADIAFVSSKDAEELTKKGFNTIKTQNTVWFLTFSQELPLEIRKSFSILASGEVFGNVLPNGTTVANSVYPPSIEANVGACGMFAYDLETAKKLFVEAIKKMPDKKLPADIKLYYYNNGSSRDMVTSIVGHWQNHLGAYINIEEVSSADVLQSQLKEQSYYMAIFPVSANSISTSSYLAWFGIDYTNGDLTQIQTEILSNTTRIPLAFESKTIAFSKLLSNVKTQNGLSLDFSFIQKAED